MGTHQKGKKVIYGWSEYGFRLIIVWVFDWFDWWVCCFKKIYCLISAEKLVFFDGIHQLLIYYHISFINEWKLP